jgi:hypothetical protein
MKTVAAAAGHEDDVNAVAYAERDKPNVIFSGSDDTLVKASGGCRRGGGGSLQGSLQGRMLRSPENAAQPRRASLGRSVPAQQ